MLDAVGYKGWVAGEYKPAGVPKMDPAGLAIHMLDQIELCAGEGM